GVSRDGGCCRLRAVFLFWSGCSDPRDLHSFPTRRSSDLTLGVLPEHVLANEFRFDEDGNIIGIDESNPLASDGGKIKALQSLGLDRKSTRLNSSHVKISYAVFCLKKKNRRGIRPAVRVPT